MDWFLYDNGLCDERVKSKKHKDIKPDQKFNGSDTIGVHRSGDCNL